MNPCVRIAVASCSAQEQDPERNRQRGPMFTSVAPTTSLSLDAHFITRPAATFFVTVDGDGLTDRGILAGDTLIVDRSRTPGPGSLVVAALAGDLTVCLGATLAETDGHVWGVVTGVVRRLR